MARQDVVAVNVLPDPLLSANIPRITALATKMRLPSVTAAGDTAVTV